MYLLFLTLENPLHQKILETCSNPLKNKQQVNIPLGIRTSNEAKVLKLHTKSIGPEKNHVLPKCSGTENVKTCRNSMTLQINKMKTFQGTLRSSHNTAHLLSRPERKCQQLYDLTYMSQYWLQRLCRTEAGHLCSSNSKTSSSMN